MRGGCCALAACGLSFGLLAPLRAQDNTVPLAPPAASSRISPVALPVVAPAATNSVADGAGAAVAAPSVVVLNPAVVKFDAAMASYNAGQFADAVTAFSEFIRDFPQDRHREEALYRLAESYRSLGRAADALAAYSYQVKTYPDGPLRINAQLRRGALLYDAGKISDALGPLREVSEKGDGELRAAATYLLGRGLLATNDEANARPILQAIADAQPRGKFAAGAAQALAEIDDREKRPDAALPLWREALELAPDAATGATLAARGGWSALTANQPAIAEQLFQQARKLGATGGAREVANSGLLRLLFQQKRYGEWVGVYQAEQDKLLAGGRAENLFDLGHAQFTLQHWSAAAEAFDQFLREFATDPAAVTAAYERFLAGSQMDRTRIVPEAEAFLKTWPQSPDRPRVQLVEAGELSAEQKFREAEPLWQSLAQEKGDAHWPLGDILLQLARARDELHDWAGAATAYRAYLDQAGAATSKSLVKVQARLAVCLQNAGQLSAATQVWELVQAGAPADSHDQEIALESLGLIYAKGGPPDQTKTADTFRILLERFPHTPLRALAAFTVGDALFKNRDYAGAEKYLLQARQWDAAAWNQPATQRLALGAYATRHRDALLAYVREYDALPLPNDPVAGEAARLPAALFYWLAEQARAQGDFTPAETFYARVTRHPEAGPLLAGAWWQLGEVQSARKEWAQAVASYETYRQLKPETKDATAVLLAEGRAQLGSGTLDAAKALGQQALLQEPEGANSAAARMLLAETALAARSNAEAARMFATLAVLFDDPKITPQAMTRAADAFTAAGDAASAAQWRQKLQARYPGFTPVPYL